MFSIIASILFVTAAPALPAPVELSEIGGIECDPSRNMSAEDILACHVKAIGGASVLDTLRNVRIKAEVSEPGFIVKADYRASRDMTMRVDIFAGEKRVFSEGIDRSGGWQQRGVGAAIESISEEGLGALMRGVEFNLLGLNNLASRGHTASLIGKILIDNVDYYIVELLMLDGFKRHFYINPTSWMIERIRETSALHPDNDPEQRPSETIQGGFSRKCGALHPMWTRKIDLTIGAEVQRTRVVSFECNTSTASLRISRGDLQEYNQL